MFKRGAIPGMARHGNGPEQASLSVGGPRYMVRGTEYLTGFLRIAIQWSFGLPDSGFFTFSQKTYHFRKITPGNAQKLFQHLENAFRRTKEYRKILDFLKIFDFSIFSVGFSSKNQWFARSHNIIEFWWKSNRKNRKIGNFLKIQKFSIFFCPPERIL